MFRHRLPRHVEVLAEGIEGLAVVLVKLVEESPAARISQCLEDIVHGPRLCNRMVACQRAIALELESVPCFWVGPAPTARSQTALHRLPF